MQSVRMGTVLQIDEEHARDFEYAKKQLLLTVVTSTFTWVRPRHYYQTGVDRYRLAN